MPCSFRRSSSCSSYSLGRPRLAAGILAHVVDTLRGKVVGDQVLPHAGVNSLRTNANVSEPPPMIVLGELAQDCRRACPLGRRACRFAGVRYGRLGRPVRTRRMRTGGADSCRRNACRYELAPVHHTFPLAGNALETLPAATCRRMHGKAEVESTTSYPWFQGLGMHRASRW